jgi:hypothetical protein
MGYLTPILSTLAPDTIVRIKHPELADDFDWQSVADQAQAVINVAERLDATPPLELPDNVVQQTQQYMTQFADLVGRVVEFDYVKVPNAHAERDQLLAHVTQQRQQMLQFSQFAAPLLPNQRDLLDVTEMSKRLSAEAQDVDALKIAAQQQVDRVAEALSRLEQGASAAAAGRLSEHYKSQVTKHEARAGDWLKAAVAAGIVLAVASVLAFTFIDTKDPTDFARDALGRLLVLGLLGYGVSFCARGYRAQTHLGIVCQQKANALDTFVLFRESADSEAAKDAVTVELVRTVFATSDSGYLDASNDKTIVQEQSAGLLSLLASRGK